MSFSEENAIFFPGVHTLDTDRDKSTEEYEHKITFRSNERVIQHSKEGVTGKKGTK